MFKIFAVLTVIAFIFVLATLVMGAVAMGGKETKDRERSNIWMRRRVLAQAIAIILLFVTFAVRDGGGA